jgi:type IV secretory pathway VirB10-like protein
MMSAGEKFVVALSLVIGMGAAAGAAGLWMYQIKGARDQRPQPTPNIIVNVPKQDAPIITVQAPPPANVNVQPAPVHVETIRDRAEPGIVYPQPAPVLPRTDPVLENPEPRVIRVSAKRKPRNDKLRDWKRKR